VIDLHLHTTASDGRLPSAALVARAADAGLTILGVTDHDTTAGLREAHLAAQPLGLRIVNGIEISAVERGRDVHVLGYFIDPASESLDAFLQQQRTQRLARVTAIGNRLRDLGCDVDVPGIIASLSRQAGKTIGRPQIADALVARGYAADRRDAFDRLLGEGRPAYVTRAGVPLAAAVAAIRGAGGIASLAHPGLLGMDDEIERFATEGLSAIEARHTDHDPLTEARYRAIAARLGLGVSGGSDFHGDDSHHPSGLGVVTLSPDDFARLESLARTADGAISPR
jgi:predicted metal-dependent phosphoesterase TrpH